MTDWWVELLAIGLLSPVAAYCIGAIVHILIDQVHGKTLVNRYFETTKREIVDPLREDLDRQLTELRAQVTGLSTVDVQGGFERFLRSDGGKQWATELGAFTAENVTRTMVEKTTSLAGNAARTAQQRIFQLIDGQLDFGNPILNGAWQAVDKGTKVRFYNQVARVIRKSGLMLVPADGGGERPLIEGEYEEVGEDNGGEVDPATLALYR